MKINKKITLLISSLQGGGAEGVCVNLANSLSNLGWIVDLVVLNLNKQVHYDKLSPKINLIILNKNHARFSIFALLKYIVIHKTKKFLVFNYELSVILLILRFFLRLNFKVYSRNINIISIKINLMKKKNIFSKYITYNLLNFFYKKSDYVINQCHDMQDDLLKVYPQLSNRCSIIFNPIPLHIENFIKTNDLNNFKKKNYILCIGRLEKQKAFHFAIEAFAGITDKFPDLRLKILGDGSLLNELKKTAENYYVTNKVDFEGFKENLISYYLHARATVLTSLYEGYPNVLIESISLNTPVIAFNSLGGQREIIQDGVNGYLVKNLDVQDMKKKLFKLLNNKGMNRNLIASLKKNNIKLISKNYEKIFTLYE